MGVMNGLRLVMAVSAALLAIFYQISLKHTLKIFGIYPSREYQSIGNTKCRTLTGIEACEKVLLHQPSGQVYMACSFPEKRRQWTPALGLFDHSGSGSDYLVRYDPDTDKMMRLKFAGFEGAYFRLSTHGFDMVPDEKDPMDIWFYLINHRKPSKGNATDIGADSVVQIFKGRPIVEGPGSSRLTWQKTINSQHMITPNEVVGSADGKSFYWTNDHGTQTGYMRELEIPLRLAKTSIGYCHVDNGCKIAASGLKASNGLASARNGTYYVGSVLGHIQTLEQQKDKTLTVQDYIQLDRGIDNLFMGADGSLYAAGFPRILDALKHFADPKAKAGSSGLRITKNIGQDSFYGQKYKVETIFEDDGTLMPPATSVVVDTQRKRLFMHGIMNPNFLICDLS